MATYHLTLSTTEPNNYVGLLKMRQGDTNTQTIQATISANGQLFKFDGLSVYLNAVLPNGNVVRDKVIEVDYANSKLNYIVADSFLQEVTQVTAWFSFETGEKIIDSTKNFQYSVIPGWKEFIPQGNYIYELSEIQREIEEIIGNKDFSSLIKRMDALETKTAYLDQVKANQTDLNAANANVALNTANIAANTSQIASLASGAPKAVPLVANMTDHTKNYVYTGSESGYTAGNWYYWNGSNWSSGGVYQSAGIADGSVVREKLDSPTQAMLDQINENLGTYQNIFRPAFVDGYVKPDGTFSASPNSQNYRTYYYSCNSGEQFKVSGSVVNQYTTLVAFFNGSNFLSYIGIGETGGTTKTFNDLKFTVPTGATKFSLLNVGTTTFPKVARLVAISNGSTALKRAKSDLPLLHQAMSNFNSLSLGTPISGYYNTDGSFSSMSGSDHLLYSFNVSPGEHYRVTGAVQNIYTVLLTFFDSSDKPITYMEVGNLSGSPIIFKDYEFIIPDGVVKFCLFNYANKVTPKVEKLEYYSGSKMSEEIDRLSHSIDTEFSGKKIAWFGTSIPAGGYIGLGNEMSYPMMVGEALCATVYNEAVGSSPAHCKWKSKITEENPYGFNGNYENCSRALGNTRAEMQWVIDNWNASFWTNAPASKPTNTDEILSFSYENKLMKHLSTGSQPVDLFVFDHGHNDQWDIDSLTPTNQYDMQTFQGTMNFFIKTILEDNPRAKIIIIGEYENQNVPKISQAQQYLANYWSIPIMPLWQFLGWSNHQINTTGYWSNGYWVPSGGASRQLPEINFWLADGVHPHSDLSGKSLQYIAKHLTSWIATNVNIN